MTARVVFSVAGYDICSLTFCADTAAAAAAETVEGKTSQTVKRVSRAWARRMI
jgi:hypothetical protein